MRGFFVSLAASASLIAASPSAGQSPVPALDAEAALDCGVAYAAFAGMTVEDEPEVAAAWFELAAAWFYLAYERLSDEDEFDALVDLRTDELLAYLDASEYADEVEAIMTAPIEACEALQLVHSSEFEAAAAAIQAEQQSSE